MAGKGVAVTRMLEASTGCWSCSGRASAGCADMQAVRAYRVCVGGSGGSDLVQEQLECPVRHLLDGLDDGGHPDQARAAVRQSVAADDGYVFGDPKAKGESVFHDPHGNFI